ncbi:Hsp20 family protein [Roseovarius salis]|uniref:Hsp20/alpha crystallin family protein n=1 Tax=Roseovarius salis TaxID=3376063 RepID=UPI0037C7D67B
MNMQSLIPFTRRAPSAWHRESDPVMTLQSEMNRLFDDVFRTVGNGTAGSWPRVDLIDAGDHVRVDAELAGMTEDDIDITLKDGVLTLSGERRIDEEDEERRISERFVGRFVRHIPLGYDVDEDNVEADLPRDFSSTWN